MRSALAAVMGATMVAVIGLSSTAVGLEVSIRGESQLRWDVQPLGTMVWVEAQLVEDVGEPLPQRAVSFRLEGEDGTVGEVREYTDFFGRAEAIMEGQGGKHRLEGRFAGSHHLEGAQRSVELELEERPAEVSLSVPAWGIAGQSPMLLQTQATIEGIGLPGYATVLVDGSEVASVELDRRGRGQFDLSPYVEAGERRVSVEVEGGQGSGPSRADERLHIYEELSVDGEVEDVFERHRRGVYLSARISDGAKGVEGVRAILEWNGEGNSLQKEVESNSVGEVQALFEESEFDDGIYQSRIRIPLEEGEEIVWEGDVYEARQATGDRWLRGFAWLVLLAGLLLGGGQTIRALARLELSGRDRSPKEEDIEEMESSHSNPPVASSDGEKVGEKSWIVELWDDWRAEPVEDAALWVNGESQPIDGGRQILRSEKLEWPVTIEAQAPGYMGVRREVEEAPPMRRWRVRMRPIPIEVRHRYRELVRRIGKPDQWGKKTPREMGKVLLNGSVEKAQRERMERLIAVVEETNFSGQEYDEEVVKEVHGIIEAIVQNEHTNGTGGRDEPLQ